MSEFDRLLREFDARSQNNSQKCTLFELLMPDYTEKDWKLFRSKVRSWQEAYMDRLNKEYIAIMNEDGAKSLTDFKIYGTK